MFGRSASTGMATASGVLTAWLAPTALELVDLASVGTGLADVTVVGESSLLLARLIWLVGVGVVLAVLNPPARNSLLSVRTTARCPVIVVSLRALAEVAELVLWWIAVGSHVASVPALPSVPAPLSHHLLHQRHTPTCFHPKNATSSAKRRTQSNTGTHVRDKDSNLLLSSLDLVVPLVVQRGALKAF